MKTLTASMQTLVAGENVTLATCWYIERIDGTKYYFTDHDTDIVVAIGGADGTIVDGTYASALGYSSTAIESGSDGSVSNLDVNAIIDLSGVTEQDLRNGLFDDAEVYVFSVNYNDPGPTHGIIKQKRGFLGDVEVKNGAFRAELRGLAQMLQQTVGLTYSPHCDVDLGSTKCGISLSGITATGVVSATSTSKRQFNVTDRVEVTGWFNYGLLTWTSGANTGISMEVKRYIQGAPSQFQLYHGLPNFPQAGDGYSVYAGCDKLSTTCKNKFSNFANFRGFPFMAGLNDSIKYPDAAS